MNKILIYIVGAVVIVGVVVVVMKHPSSENADQQGKSSAAPGEAKSLKTLLGVSTPQKCTFAHEVQGATSTGTVYAIKGKMRGDFSSTVSGQTIQSHMIVDGQTSYVWSDMMSQGFKISIESAATPNPQAQGQVDINQGFNFSCESWSGDSSMFGLPKGITFTDMMSVKAAVSPAAGSTSSQKEMQCNACNSAPEPQRTQCRTALACK